MSTYIETLKTKVINRIENLISEAQYNTICTNGDVWNIIFGNLESDENVVKATLLVLFHHFR